MCKERLLSVHVSCRRLRLVFLTVAATLAVCAICSVLFSATTSARTSVPITTRLQPLLHPRWKRYGATNTPTTISGDSRRTLAISMRSIKRSPTKLFSIDAKEKGVEELVNGLRSLQVSCQPGDGGEPLGEKYAKFLQVLAIYTKFHAKEKSTGPDDGGGRKMLWVCDARRACGGLADRMKGVTYALILAMLSRRVLVLDWTDQEFGEYQYLKPNQIDWRMTKEERISIYGNVDDFMQTEYQNTDPKDLENVQQAIQPSIANLHIFSTLGGYGIDVPYDELQVNLEQIEGTTQWIVLESNMEPSSLQDEMKTASQQWIRQGIEALGLDKLSLLEIDRLIGVVFRYLFKFSEDLLVEVAGARHVLGLGSAPYTGVHLRTGFIGSPENETVQHPKLYKFQNQWLKTLSCAFSHSTKLYGRSSLIFLATDSKLVKQSVIDDARYRTRFRTLNNSVVHLDRLEKMPHEAGEFEKEGVLSAWVELILLAEADSVVIGESGFAFLAQCLCFIPHSKTIDELSCKTQEYNHSF